MPSIILGGVGTDMEIPKLTPNQIEEMLGAGEHFYFVDARREDVWREANTKAPGALRVTPSEPKAFVKEIPGGATKVVYCTCPDAESSMKVAETFRRYGHSNVYVLQGGFDAWMEAGGETERMRRGEALRK